MENLDKILLQEGDDVRILSPKKGDIIVVTGMNGAMIAQMITQLTMNMEFGGGRVPIVVLPGGDLGDIALTTLSKLKADIEQFEFQELQRDQSH